MNGRISRRGILKGAACTAAALTFAGPTRKASAENPGRVDLSAEFGETQLVPEQYGKTGVWCFNNKVPGPEIRARQGDMVEIRVTNALDEETTVHWHGVRVPNDMDGVPHLTQVPIAPGGDFHYRFKVEDAGTFWYHPHQRSMIQVGRGLYGALVVEEADPILVDRDITWILDDWRLEPSAQIAGNFDRRHDLSHAGRIGNTVTINGSIPDDFKVNTGERIRLRLVNAANARIFALDFESHDPRVIAIDGQPVEPHSPKRGRIELAPGMRMDLVLDMSNDPGTSHRIVDDYYPNNSYLLATLRYSGKPLRESALDASIALAPNPLAEPDPESADRHKIVFEGGAMGNMEGAVMDGNWQDIRTMAHKGKFWAINGVAATGHMMDPLLTLERHRSVVFEMENSTAWPHPIHLHGHSFRVLSRNGQPTRYREWQDTVLMERNERVEIAFVADNPGNWMFHCHILEHQASGMMGVIKVT